MKRITSLLLAAVVCLGAARVSSAADDPLFGTWKMNVEKSKMTPPEAMPKSMTRTVEADGDGAKYSFETTKADGSTGSYHFAVKFDAKDYEISGNGAPYGADHIAIKKISAHSYSSTLKRGGKVVGSTKVTISADGKTATLVQKGTDDKGKKISGTVVYEKQ
jgi:hypothetical protein